MEEIIKINYDAEQPTVSARELHEGLEIKSNFTTWFDRMCENGLTENDYTVRGSTALIDAIGGAIHHIGNIHKYAREEDVPEHTLFVIMTDGMENASRIYSSNKVKKMIERQKNRYGWEFLFIGANIDSVETAKHFGIDPDADQQRSAGFGTLDHALDALESAVAGKAFVASDRFTAADVYVGSQIDWGL